MSKLKEIQGVLAQNVRKLRGERGINAFARYCGLGNHAIETIERGEGNPGIATLCSIAHKFGLETWHLFIRDLDPALKPRVLTSRELALYQKFEQLRSELPAENSFRTTKSIAAQQRKRKNP